MHKIPKILLSFCLTFTSSLLFADKIPTSAVTYTFSGGRLGDNLLSYLHAKYVSYLYGIPLLLKKFPFSDDLVLSDVEQQFDAKRKFTATAQLKKNELISFQPYSNTLYVIPYFPECLEEHRVPDCDHLQQHAAKRCEFAYFAVDWNDHKFLKEIKALIKPKKSLKLIYPPTDCISVAVHVRKNCGGYDLPFLHGLPESKYNPKQLYVDVVFPLKHPADDYYIEQIQRLAKMFENQNLYVFLFTDDPNPVAILNKYRALLGKNSNITLDCRREENRYDDTNVLIDFFSMLNFDCLIRPDANLSIVASKLGDYKIQISPVHHRWEKRNLIIDKVLVTINN